jgi:hypothetical protein
MSLVFTGEEAEQLKQKTFRLPTVEHPYPMPFFQLDVGDKIWYPFNAYFVVEATVTQLVWVLTHPSFKRTLWAYAGKDGYKLITNTAENVFQFEYLDPTEVLAGCTLCKQEVSIDEPVGHAVELGYDVFLTLGEALAAVHPHGPCRKRVKRAALAAKRRGTREFVSGTHHKSVEAMGWPRLPRKRVYYRKR